MDNSKEPNQSQINNPDKTTPPQNKAKPISSFTPVIDKTKPSIMSRQNSAFKNVNNEIKNDTGNLYPNMTPRKQTNNDYYNYNSIISPFREPPNFVDTTPYDQGKYNISSPENLRFGSPIIFSDGKNYFGKNNADIQGKKIDFGEEAYDIMKLNNQIPINQMNNGYCNRIYNTNQINQNNYNINNNNNNIDYSNQKSIVHTTNLNNLNSSNMNIVPNNTNSIGKCTCSKTGCRKKYCACFSRGKYCDGCECKNCQNFPRSNNIQPSVQNIVRNEENIENPKAQRVICNCTKSNCMKKYCECYKQGFKCNSLCRCLECKNKIYINNNIINNNNENINYNMNANSNISNINNESNGYNNYNLNNNNNMNDSINTNNFYNYALHNNINNNIINNNIINNSYIPETFGKSLDYSNPINFQSEAFGICIKNYELKYKIRKLNLNDEKNLNKKEVINNNLSEINETPKFSGKKRLRAKNDNSTGAKTCPTTNSNSSNKLRKAIPVVNKSIKKKRLQLS